MVESARLASLLQVSYKYETNTGNRRFLSTCELQRIQDENNQYKELYFVFF
jgi:hypothetical protein